ncbi:unnamed protein product (macronuclear) [Paramecium tetraurelia]|uniref:VWFA domain-containing protein n=1 Tax=Paramecium tetraurelia TaxID=5888 RepID=A0CBH4_PARTE|nr:uncharacterized protein GSPATT00036924001 [Paramecium tetraurelia]CAK68141.1 unnamed protein product [Paramecium tetraurelia]|eukprot:XP_001435538.1 hypothetical protein (macronuclear) [Paramecium tetraurelia strain d4-2]
MNQDKQFYLYTIVDQKPDDNFSVVGVIDGSGSMSECWEDLCKAWNHFLLDIQSSYCIQFDDTAILQQNPKLNQQKGEGTNISLGFHELIKLVKSEKLKKNVIVIFITDGVGEDKLEDYIDDLAENFSLFHEQEYQFKFFTLAIGETFSHTIVAELKNRIHNSTLISSQMEYIQDSKVDFANKLQQIKEEIFYKLVRVEPPVSLVPYGKKLRRLAPNQTIFSETPIIKVNGEEINLKQYQISYHDLYQFVNQVFLKLMEDSTRGLKTIKEEATKQLQIINSLIKRVAQEEGNDYKQDIDETIQKIKAFSLGQQQLKLLSAKDAAQSITKLQSAILAKNFRRQDNYEQKPVPNEKLEKAKQRLSVMKKSVKIKTIYTQIEQFFKENSNASPQLLVKLLQEKRAGQNLQRYALEYQSECTILFELMYICNQ